MRAGIVVNVPRGDRHRLEAIVSDRSAPQKHVWRANIILATAEGCGTAEIMRRSGKSKPVVWRWQARFMAEGVEGLTRDKTRKPGKQPLPTGTVQRVVDLAARAAAGRSNLLDRPDAGEGRRGELALVQRILEAHQLAPHRIRTFKLSNDPKFAEKLKRRRRPLRRSPRPCGRPLGRREEIPWGVDSDRRSGRVRLLTHPLWRRPCKLSLTDPKR
jgi:transposase